MPEKSIRAGSGGLGQARAGLAGLASAAMFAALTHMVSHQLAPDLPQGVAIDLARQSYNIILGFGLSIPVFFVTANAWVMWIVVPLLVSRWRHIRRRRRNRAAGEAQRR